MPGLPSIHSGVNAGRNSKKNKYSLGPSDRDPASVKRAREFAQTLTASTRTETKDGRSHAGPSSSRTVGKAPAKDWCDASAFKLSPAESYMAAQKEEVAERWRSLLLEYQTGLRELVASGSAEPPSLSRVVKLLKLYDGVCRCAEDQSPYLAEMLRLFRVEFCRAIFSSYDVGVGDEWHADNSDEAPLATYFDHVMYLLRENAMLSSELSLSNSPERVTELTKEVSDMTETMRLYENEVGRLTRQSDNLMNQVARLQIDVAEGHERLQQQALISEREVHDLNVQNKDLQLQLFRLRKQVAGGKNKLIKDTYQQIKLSKMGTHATLFSEGDERIGLLVMLSQLESRVNEILDRYDNDYVLFPTSMHSDLRSKMGTAVAVVLEEMHLCEQSYKRLVPVPDRDASNEDPDETDGYVAIMFDHKIYENLLAREAIKRKLQFLWDNTDVVAMPVGPLSSEEQQHSSKILEGALLKLNKSSEQSQAFTDIASPTSENGVASGKFPLATPASPTGVMSPRQPHKSVVTGEVPNDVHLSLEDLVFLKRNQWVERVFRNSPEEILMDKIGVRRLNIVPLEAIPPDVLLARLLRHPMKDLSGHKFLSAVDIYTGSDPVQQKFLCAVNYVDPSVPIQLPENTLFVKVKYQGSFFTSNLLTEDRPPTVNICIESPGKRPSDTTIAVSKTAAPRSANQATRNRQSVTLVSGKTNPVNQLKDWGAKSVFPNDDSCKNDEPDESACIYSVNENLRVFRELTNPQLMNGGTSLQNRAAAVSSTTASMVAFQRLNPLSPNRAPEWILYKNLFGGYRSLTPRLLEVTTIDHILMSACERHFTRMGYRYNHCEKEAENRATNHQMTFLLAERFFRESHELSDFQNAVVDELEARYCYPELVAKNMYEILCYLDAMSGKDKLLDLYINVIRGFQPPTLIHYITYMLFHLSYCWPTPNPSEEISRDDALTVFQYLYRHCDKVVTVNVNDVIHDYEVMTRYAPFTFVGMRQFLGSTLIHQEDSILLYLNGYYSTHCEGDCLQQLTYESYRTATAKNFREKSERNSLIRYLSTALGFNRGPLLTAKDFALITASLWCSDQFHP